MIYEKPLFFEQNRVSRVYKGGKLLGDFVGEVCEDTNYPEEWIASTVKAEKTIGGKSSKDGISKIKGEDLYLDELIEKYPQEVLGDKKEHGVLVKYLDSSIKLAVQAHPDKTFSKKYFNAEHGKEESWIVLAKRPGACVYFGFKDGVTQEQFEAAIDASKADSNAMCSLLNRIEVEPGDVIFVPAKAVHAIGAGCFMLEVQEPTDFTVEPEHWCGDYKLSEAEMFMGLSRDIAIECFDFNTIKQAKLTPTELFSGKGVIVEELIGKKQTDNFGVNKVTLSGGEFYPEKDAGIYVVTSGEGALIGGNYNHMLKQGDYFMMPHLAVGKFKISGNIVVMECYA